MRTRNVVALWAIAAVVLWFGWPTPYRDVEMRDAWRDSGAIAVRVHRLTGRVQVLSPDRGWRTLPTPFERAQQRAGVR